MHSLLLTLKCKQTEWTLIQLITQNNNFLQKLVQNLSLQIHCKKTNQDETNGNNKNKKWTTFTYYSPRIRKIMNLFKHTNVGIAFKSTSTLQQLTKPKQVSNTQELDKSAICKLTCNTCQMSYIGQTSRSLRQISGTHKVYKTQRTPIILCTAHPKQQTRIRSHQ